MNVTIGITIPLKIANYLENELDKNKSKSKFIREIIIEYFEKNKLIEKLEK